MNAANSAVIFDVDGTLWDSEPGIVSCLTETLIAFGIEPPPPAELRTYLGPPLDAMLALLGIAAEDIETARTTYRAAYREHGEFECTPYDGIVELLTALRTDGRRLGVATSKGVEVVQRMLVHFDLVGFFDTIHAAAMAASGHGKEHLVGDAVAALSTLGAEGGVMIGDRNFDIEAGKAHGLATIGVSWGYADPGELETADADLIVGTVDELAAALRHG